MRDLSDQELDVYSRQIALDQIGYEGQVRLRHGRAAIIGMGGLGSAVATQLTAMGIGSLRMVDRDIVSRSDLHRQHLYDTEVLGRPKVEAALNRLAKLNPDVALDPVPESMTAGNVDSLIQDVDVVIDGLDRPEPRYLLNRAAVKRGIPYVFGGAIQTSGNVTTILPGRTCCLECFMPGLRDDDLPKCAVVGVHPSILGFITSTQVFEAVRILLGQDPLLADRLLIIDLDAMEFRIIEMERLSDCAVCGSPPGPRAEPPEEKYFEESCSRDGKRTFIVSPTGPVDVDLERIAGAAAERGFQVISRGRFGLTFHGPHELIISVLNRGTMVAQAPPNAEQEPAEQVRQLYQWVMVDVLGLPRATVPAQ